MEAIIGYVKHIVFRNKDNGYTVFCLAGDENETTCVGNFHEIQEGEMLEATGEYVTHSVYGKQFKVCSYAIREPEDVESVERYLGSGAIKGVGPVLASRIVRKFGKATFRVIGESPEMLSEVKGISKKKALNIAAEVNKKKDMRRAMIYLQNYGIGVALAVKIYRFYGMNLYQVMKENPYRLAEDIDGVGFKTADEIAAKAGILFDSEFRIRSGILYTLTRARVEGHIYLPYDALLQRASDLLGVQIKDMESFIEDLSIERKIVRKDEKEGIRIYPSQFYYMELHTAKMLHDLDIDCSMPEEMMEDRLRKVEEQEKISPDSMQHKAVIESIRHGLLILTGGPGTGKTTTINTMIRFFKSEGMTILLAAPTGRAAKRMTDATGVEARTIHRLLEVSGIFDEDGKEGGFLRNSENPLECDVLIIDEMSMVDLPLMHALLSAVVPGTRLILVGDVNQLPPVGPGSVLKDIIASGVFPVVTLSHIFRQAGKSDIVVNAHKINAGERVDLGNKSRDFFFLKRRDADSIIETVTGLLRGRLPQYVGAKPLEIQIMTPTRKGLLGVDNLNLVLQQLLNPPSPLKAEKECLGKKFRVGDKVMQVKNNYRLEWRSCTGQDCGTGVFNGDTGIVCEIDPYQDTLKVVYDEQRRVTYTRELLEELDLAYAITVHKSQGSEYPAVIIPLLSGPRLLFTRNLLYTAVTRAKKCLIIVGREETFQEMIKNKSEQERYTSLAERIRQF